MKCNAKQQDYNKKQRKCNEKQWGYNKKQRKCDRKQPRCNLKQPRCNSKQKQSDMKQCNCDLKQIQCKQMQFDLISKIRKEIIWTLPSPQLSGTFRKPKALIKQKFTKRAFKPIPRQVKSTLLQAISLIERIYKEIQGTLIKVAHGITSVIANKGFCGKTGHCLPHKHQ